MYPQSSSDTIDCLPLSNGLWLMMATAIPLQLGRLDLFALEAEGIG
jgi:hypothetical protein